VIAEGKRSRGALPVGFGGVVDRGAVEQIAGDRFGAGVDGGERGGADQVGQAADHPAGVLVQIPVQATSNPDECVSRPPGTARRLIAINASTLSVP
jgi:hypothetical protein